MNHYLLLLPFAILVSVTSAQRVANVCSLWEMQQGIYLKPHESSCSLYYQCNSDLSGIVRTCPAGSFFDNYSKTCTGPQWASCRSAVVTTSRPICTNRADPNNPCTFQSFDTRGNFRGVQNCAEGTSFDANSCQCSGHAAQCSRSKTSNLNGECKATMEMDFSTRTPTAYTYKSLDGQRRRTNYYISTSGYTPAGSEGILATGADGDAPNIYLWPFESNMLKGPFAIKVSFKVDYPREGYSFTIIGNGIPHKSHNCPGTLDIKATYRRGRWDFAIKVVGRVWEDGKKKVAQQDVWAPSQSDNGYISASLMFSKETKSVSGYVAGQPWGPLVVGDEIVSESCGLALGYGLEGRLSEARFYESCKNENHLRSLVQ